jgi:hypothetical protein
VKQRCPPLPLQELRVRFYKCSSNAFKSSSTKIRFVRVYFFSRVWIYFEVFYVRSEASTSSTTTLSPAMRGQRSLVTQFLHLRTLVNKYICKTFSDFEASSVLGHAVKDGVLQEHVLLLVLHLSENHCTETLYNKPCVHLKLYKIYKTL